MRASIGFGSCDDRREAHVAQDVALDVDPRRDLGQLHAGRRAPEHAALGDVEHRLAGLGRIGAAEGDLLDRLDELARLCPSRTIRSRPSSTAISSPPAVKVPANTTLRAFWLMLMNPPAPASLRAEPADVDVARGVDLRHPQAGQVEPAAVVEVELLVLVRSPRRG